MESKSNKNQIIIVSDDFEDIHTNQKRKYDQIISSDEDLLETIPGIFGSKEYIFNPEFTNQIFREDEEIHGYRDLKINIHITGAQLYAYLDYSYSYKSPDADEIKPILNEVFRAGR